MYGSELTWILFIEFLEHLRLHVMPEITPQVEGALRGGVTCLQLRLKQAGRKRWTPLPSSEILEVLCGNSWSFIL